MRIMLISMLFWANIAVAECNTLSFDYSSFSRPPGKVTIDRYVAGHQDVNYLSIGLRGITLQISPANTAQDQDLPDIWQAWRTVGKTHPDYLNFHTYHTRPTLVETPLNAEGQGHHSVQTDGGTNVIEFIFFIDAQDAVFATAYLNDPVGDADWDGVVDELAGLLSLDKSCISNTGRYEGKYEADAARYVIFPTK